MATSRQERMQERMRGAGRHQVEDISFGFVLPVEEEQFLEEPPQPIPPSPINTKATPPTDVLRRPTPNTSVKRKHLSSENAPRVLSPPAPPPPAIETPPAAVAPVSPSEVDDSPGPDNTETPLVQATQSSTQSQPSGLRRVSYDEEVEVRESDSSGGLSKKRTSVPLSSPAATPRVAALVEEVGESPANAPGSGRRRPLRSDPTPVIGSSTILQRVLEELDDTTAGLPSSSPVERLKANRRTSDSLRSGASRVASRAVETRRRSPRVSEGSVAASDGVDGPSSPVIIGHGEDNADDHGDSSPEVDAVPDDEDDQDAAEEITEKEAAGRLGRKRHRRSLPAASPELGSGLGNQVQPEEEPEPLAKRRRTKKVTDSPAAQQQPKTRGPKAKTKAQTKAKALPKKQTTKKKSNSRPHDGDEQGEAGAGSIAVTVQRFTKNNATIQWGSDEEDDDVGNGILTGEIPFASRAGVNVIDVLSILSEELVNSFLSKLQQRAQEADDAATKREQKTMASALEAFQEELRTRLLEHTIALDTVHAVLKRLRVAQKERLALRDEIMRIRAERDQVGLRMDAIRMEHEAESKEALRRVSLSSAMHDIDLAVERGHAAPPLSAAEQKKADLAGLELLVSRVAEKVCPRSDTGGTLKQIRDFNAFLERAAGVLERKS